MQRNVHLSSWAADIDGDGNIWISHFGLNGLFRYDTNKNEIYSLGSFDEMPLNQIEMHSLAKNIDNYVFFVPLRDTFLRRLNKKTGVIDRFSAPDSNSNEKGTYIIGDNKIYYHSQDGKIYTAEFIDVTFEYDVFLSAIASEFHELLDSSPNKNSLHADQRYVMDYQEGYILLYYRDRLCMINECDQTYKIIELKDDKTFQVFINSEEVWITHAYDFDIGKYNLYTKEYVKYSGDGVEWKDIPDVDKLRPYSKLSFSSDYVWIPNYRARTVYRIDKRKGEIEQAFIDNDSHGLTQWAKRGLYPDYYSVISQGVIKYFIPCGAKHLIKVGPSTQKTEFRDFCIAEEDLLLLDEYIKQASSGCICENEEVFSLESFVEYL